MNANNGPVKVSNQKMAFLGLKWIFLGLKYQFGLEPEFWKAGFEDLLLLLSIKSNKWEMSLGSRFHCWGLYKIIKSTIAEKQVNWKLKTILFFWGFKTQVSKFRLKTNIQNLKIKKLNFWLHLFKNFSATTASNLRLIEW